MDDSHPSDEDGQNEDAWEIRVPTEMKCKLVGPWRTSIDDALIVSRMKSSSLILILEIAKEELSYTGVVPATESPMPKSECVNQKKLC